MNSVKKSPEGTLEDKIKTELFGRALGFEGIPRYQLGEYASKAFFRSFEKGEVILCEGESPAFFDILTRGRIKLYKTSANGTKIIFHIIDPVRPVTYSSAVTGQGSVLTAESVGEATLLSVKREDFVAFLSKNPILFINFMVIMSSALNSAYKRIIDMTEMRVDKRIITILNTLYKKMGPHLKITSVELAELACTTSETSLRVISKLRDSGIIESRRGEIMIVAPAKLESISGEIYSSLINPNREFI